jgi:alpha-L-rhamnosidase
VPDVPALDPEQGFTAIWGDAAVLTPWDLYTAYADAGMLAEQYPAARRWVEGLRSVASDETLILDQFQFGDWLDPTAPADNALAAKADSHLLATAYYFRSTAVLARIAEVIGEHEDARRYAELAERIRVAFLDRFSPEPGRLVDDAQASYAIAIRFGVFGDAATARAAGDRLAELVRENGFRIGTGFAGTPVICDALAETGHLAEAYAMLLETECPSWLYPVTRGATTIWERWDSLLPNGRVNSGGMTSFNHYALGAVADFLHRQVAGIAPAAPGYERILFRPRPGGGLTSAGATLDTPFGEASIDWTLDGDALTVTTRVPVGATAVLDLEELGRGIHELGHGTSERTVRPASVSSGS